MTDIKGFDGNYTDELLNELDKAELDYTKVDDPDGLQPLAFDVPFDIVNFCKQRDVNETKIAFVNTLGGSDDLPNHVVYINTKN